MKKIITIILLVLLIGCINQEMEVEQICFGEDRKPCVDVEIAETKEKREKGLMNREKLAENQGMLFLFPEQKAHAFWMKNTTIPLDIIWIGANQEIVDIKQNAPPCEGECKIYRPEEKAIFVLEVNANYTREHNISKGTKVYLQENQPVS